MEAAEGSELRERNKGTSKKTGRDREQVKGGGSRGRCNMQTVWSVF